MSRYNNPQPQYLDDNGVPVSGGKLFFYRSETTTLLDTFSDIALTTPNTNPVILDGDGRPSSDIFLNGSYKVRLTTSTDTLIWEKDPVGSIATGAAFSAWSAVLFYDQDDIVKASDNQFYISLTNGNVNNDPTTSPANWSEIRLLTVDPAAFADGTTVPLTADPTADTAAARTSTGAIKAANALNADEAVALGQLPDGVADLYAKNNIVGAVTRSGGVVTGAILEYGSNANGEYLKMADGTLFCWRIAASISNPTVARGQIFASSDMPYSMPATYISQPKRNHYIFSISTQPIWPVNSESNTPSDNEWRFRMASSGSQTGVWSIELTAVGRWN